VSDDKCAVYDHIPQGFLDCPAGRLAELLPGPTLLDLKGRDPRPLFVSVLLHGNEDSGLAAAQETLRRRAGHELPRSLLLFIGNVRAAARNLRTLPGQLDFNRVWPGTQTPDAPEARMARWVYDYAAQRRPFAALDIHNNTGFNPHYACVTRLEPKFVALAQLFSRIVVHFQRPRGVAAAAFANLCPSATMECGKAGGGSGAAHAAELMDAALAITQLPEHDPAPQDVDLLRTFAIVKTPPQASFSFDDSAADFRFRAELDHLNFSELSAGNKPAAHSLEQDVHNAVPEIQLNSLDENAEEEVWLPQADLLSSQANDLHFVAELDNEGRAHLRFGNGELGRKLEAGMKFNAKYRIGSGLEGNVGAESISHVVFRNNQLDGIKSVRNPMPAEGGTEREPISEVKLFAPHAFRKELQRAVIADDYAAIVLREFKNKVQNSIAKLRWNGNWYVVWVAVDPFGREEAEQALLDEITCRLHRYRRIGHDLVVKSAQRVPLDIELAICVRSNYLRGHVKAELWNIFSNKRLSNGKLGFFHPDNLTFGDDIYLSKLVAAAQSVQGIESVEVTKMQRFGELENNEIENGLLPLSPFEIARLDNNPSFPENGKLTLDMRGGR